jgi:protein-tyrosine-phosphatase
VLATRFARDRLRAAALIEGSIMTDKPDVLFVCVHNAGRSQMAAGLLNQHAAGRVTVRSAGSAPADTINPAVVQVMNEKGIDISVEFPKTLTTEAVQASDVVITMGCGDACPVFPGKRYLDWKLDDPAGQDIDTVRRIRDEIDAKVQELLAELPPGAGGVVNGSRLRRLQGARSGLRPPLAVRQHRVHPTRGRSTRKVKIDYQK